MKKSAKCEISSHSCLHLAIDKHGQDEENFEEGKENVLGAELL